MGTLNQNKKSKYVINKYLAGGGVATVVTGSKTAGSIAGGCVVAWLLASVVDWSRVVASVGLAASVAVVASVDVVASVGSVGSAGLVACWSVAKDVDGWSRKTPSKLDALNTRFCR